MSSEAERRHLDRNLRLHAALQLAAPARGPLGLAKATSNLFRDRSDGSKQRLDLNDYCHVLDVRTELGCFDAEGMTSYETLVNVMLPSGLMPAVVPQLKTITLGGAAAGVGIEATSFRHGLVHDSLLEIEVLLPGGDIVLCTPDNQHSDLFFGFPNSYGTLGYALRLKARAIPVKPFVEVVRQRHRQAAELFDAMAACCAGDADFIDAVVFGADDLVINIGRFVDEAPWTSDYGFEQIYYRSIQHKDIDYLQVQDYLWRWDTDWFWCSKNFQAQRPLVRRLLGRKHLNSRTYARLMRLNARLGLTRRLAQWRGRHPESVIQDVDIPIARAAEFLAFLLSELGILPIWICPIRAADPSRRFTLYPLTPGAMYVNFGFWEVIETKLALEPGHFNRLVERKLIELGGIKSLYSDSYFTPEEFAQAYAMTAYQRLKAKYDPGQRTLGLYDKCVLRR